VERQHIREGEQHLVNFLDVSAVGDSENVSQSNTVTVMSLISSKNS
jgi:hypothetical protein